MNIWSFTGVWVSLPGDKSLRKICFSTPRNHHLSNVPQQQVESHEPLPTSHLNIDWLSICRSQAEYKHRHCEVMNVVVLPCLDDIVHLQFCRASGFYNLSNAASMISPHPWKEGYYRYSTYDWAVHTHAPRLDQYEVLCQLWCTTQRSLSDEVSGLYLHLYRDMNLEGSFIF